MGEIMQFPETVEEFMQQYKITDSEQIYTNGAELVPIFRMQQWFEAHKQRWIPCSERLPESDEVWQKYIVVYCYNYRDIWDDINVMSFVTVADYNSEQKVWSLSSGEVVNALIIWESTPLLAGCVTHWMPLPEPPEEGGNKNAAD